MSDTIDPMWSPSKLARFASVPAWTWGDLIVAREGDRWHAYRRARLADGSMATKPLADAGAESAAWTAELAQQWAERTFKQRRAAAARGSGSRPSDDQGREG